MEVHAAAAAPASCARPALVCSLLYVCVESLIFSMAQITLFKIFYIFTFYLAECTTIFYLRVDPTTTLSLFFLKSAMFYSTGCRSLLLYVCAMSRARRRSVSPGALWRRLRLYYIRAFIENMFSTSDTENEKYFSKMQIGCYNVNMRVICSWANQIDKFFVKICIFNGMDYSLHVSFSHQATCEAIESGRAAGRVPTQGARLLHDYFGAAPSGRQFICRFGSYGVCPRVCVSVGGHVGSAMLCLRGRENAERIMVPMYISILSHLEFHYTFRIQILIFKINSDQSVVSATRGAATGMLFVYSHRLCSFQFIICINPRCTLILFVLLFTNICIHFSLCLALSVLLQSIILRSIKVALTIIVPNNCIVILKIILKFLLVKCTGSYYLKQNVIRIEIIFDCVFRCYFRALFNVLFKEIPCRQSAFHEL